MQRIGSHVIFLMASFQRHYFKVDRLLIGSLKKNQDLVVKQQSGDYFSDNFWEKLDKESFVP